MKKRRKSCSIVMGEWRILDMTIWSDYFDGKDFLSGGE